MSMTYPDFGYATHGHVVYRCHYHVVWCTKYRRKLLDSDISARLRQIAFQVAGDLGFGIDEMEIMDDHVHLLLDVPPKIGIAKAVRMLKGRSSRILREEFPSLRSRVPTLWTRSYFCTTVGGAPLAVVKRYIENQKNV